LMVPAEGVEPRMKETGPLAVPPEGQQLLGGGDGTGSGGAGENWKIRPSSTWYQLRIESIESSTDRLGSTPRPGRGLGCRVNKTGEVNANIWLQQRVGELCSKTSAS